MLGPLTRLESPEGPAKFERRCEVWQNEIRAGNVTFPSFEGCP